MRVTVEVDFINDLVLLCLLAAGRNRFHIQIIARTGTAPVLERKPSMILLLKSDTNSQALNIDSEAALGLKKITPSLRQCTIVGTAFEFRAFDEATLYLSMLLIGFNCLTLKIVNVKAHTPHESRRVMQFVCQSIFHR